MAGSPLDGLAGHGDGATRRRAEHDGGGPMTMPAGTQSGIAVTRPAR